MKPKSVLIFFFVAFQWSIFYCSAQLNLQVEPITSADSVSIKYSQIITSAGLKKHLSILASDEYEGRETGKKGQKMAAEYIANHFKSLNFPPIGNNNTYYQTIPLIEEGIGNASMNINGIQYDYLKDFYSYSRGNKDFYINANEVIFLGYGIENEKYNDFKGLDDTMLNGKVIMIFQKEPMKNKISYITQNKKTSEWTFQWRKKLEQAKKKGVVLILYVVPKIDKQIRNEMHSIQYTSMRLADAKKDSSAYPNFVYISEKMAQNILSSKTVSVRSLKKQIDNIGQPNSFFITCRIAVNLEKQFKNIEAENVLGYLEGTDLKDEVVVVTAHYDHLGKGEKNVYNGADDDGSGTVAVMEIAKAFAAAAREGHRPRRSILFMPVSGEEKGLLGSNYYTQHPVFPLEKTVTDLNIDMIGRMDEKHKDHPDYVYIIGSSMLSSELHQISERTNKKFTQLELDYTYNDPNDPNRFYYRSDHYNFAKNNIPIIFYFNGTHKDYHKPTDEVSKIHFPKTEKISRLVFFTAWDLANRNKRVEVDGKKDKK